MNEEQEQEYKDVEAQAAWELAGFVICIERVKDSKWFCGQIPIKSSSSIINLEPRKIPPFNILQQYLASFDAVCTRIC